MTPLTEYKAALRGFERLMKTVALNHAESFRRPDAGRALETETLDVLASGLRDAFDASVGEIPGGLLALARQVDARRALARRTA